MRLERLTVMVLCVVCAIFFLFTGSRQAAATQVGLAPDVDRLRFQIIGNEPIAGRMGARF